METVVVVDAVSGFVDLETYDVTNVDTFLVFGGEAKDIENYIKRHYLYTLRHNVLPACHELHFILLSNVLLSNLSTKERRKICYELGIVLGQ